MIIPNLPPDILFRRLQANDADLRLSYEIKREALGPHVAPKWGWDDAAQFQLHQDRFELRPYHEILSNRESLGLIALTTASEPWRLDDFYLRPHLQGQGIGTAVLRHCLGLADRAGAAVALRYLQWNPVGSLYRRNGFVEVAKTEHHFLMERPARA